MSLLSARSPHQTPDSAALQFSFTGYTGFENEILQLHNVNRDVPKTRQWLDWRYARLFGAPAPRVFWIRSRDGQAVGMASLIYRRYWVNGRARDMAVLGDISVDEHMRRQGLGRALMGFMTRTMDSWPNHAGLVIPTQAAERCLSASGWTTAGRLVPHVFLVDPTESLSRLLRHERLARGAASVFKRLVGAGLRLSVPRGSSLHIVDDVDETFDEFWRDLPKKNLFVRDMSQAALRWRYIRHPDYRFRVAKLVNEDGLAGYLIFEVSASDRTCRVYDVLVKRPRDLRRL